ncbi:capping complex subunit for YIEGIA [Terrisporobacter sp.]
MGNDIGINSYTLAIITTDKNMNTSGGCPIFYAKDDDDLQNKAMLVAKCVDGIVHQIADEILIVVRH